MSKVESFILGIFLGAGVLVFCLLITLIVTSIFFDTKTIGPWVLWLLVPGVVINIVFLKKWVKQAYQLNNKILSAIYIFYSVVALGLGMGVPIFNFALGMAAGVYSARRMYFAEADEEERDKYFKKTAVFSAVVMVLMCCLITLWAIAGKMIGYRFETPFLSFTFTEAIFWAVVFTGGSVLVLFQYWLTVAASKATVILENKKIVVKVLTLIVALAAIGSAIVFGWHVLKAYHAHRREVTQQCR